MRVERVLSRTSVRGWRLPITGGLAELMAGASCPTHWQSPSILVCARENCNITRGDELHS